MQALCLPKLHTSNLIARRLLPVTKQEEENMHYTYTHRAYHLNNKQRRQQEVSC